MQTTIYRTGLMQAGNHTDHVLKHWAEFDERRPEGQPSRKDALYASPDIAGAHYWLSNFFLAYEQNIRPAKDFRFNAITVESDNVRVYRVDDYNRVGNQCDQKETPCGVTSSIKQTSIDSYWNTSKTLTEWRDAALTDTFGSWEILLPEKEIISYKPLTYGELRELYLEQDIKDYRLNLLDKNFRWLFETSAPSFSSSP